MTTKATTYTQWFAQHAGARLRTLTALAMLVAAAAVNAPAVKAEGIERNGESRILYSTIKVPAGAETLYMSGMGASPLPDGTWGDMEQQAIDIFTKFKTTLEAQGWSMSDIVQVRVFGIAGPDGVLDFEGFNRGYLAFFGTPENPTKPVRTFVQVADLVRDGWLVEVEVQAARVP